MPPVEHYQGEKGRLYQEVKRSIPHEAVPWIGKVRAAKLQPYIKGTDVVFEFGVGYGWNLVGLNCALKVGWDASEFLKEEVEKQGIEFVDLRASSAAADIIICHHTLEHLLMPAETLKELRPVLRKGGKLLLFVPFEKERRYRSYNPVEPNHHLYSWNVQTLGNLVSECGYIVESGSGGRFGYERFAAKTAIRWHLGEFGFRLIHALAHFARPGLEVRMVATLKT